MQEDKGRGVEKEIIYIYIYSFLFKIQCNSQDITSHFPDNGLMPKPKRTVSKLLN